MEWMGWLAIGLLCAGALGGLVGGLWGRRLQKQNPPVYSTEAAPIQELQATVVGKDVEKQMTGSYQTPGHFLVYLVRFLVQDGPEYTLAVPKEEYDQLYAGERGVLGLRGKDTYAGFDPASSL